MEYPTSAHGYQLGLRFRVPRAFHVAATYGVDVFAIDDAGDAMPKPAFPSVAYRFLRLGTGVEIPSLGGSRIGARAQLGYRHILSAGEIESAEYFPRLSAAGFDVDATVTCSVTPAIEARLGLHLERYVLALAPEPGVVESDSPVAPTTDQVVLSGNRQGAADVTLSPVAVTLGAIDVQTGESVTWVRWVRCLGAFRRLRGCPDVARERPGHLARVRAAGHDVRPPDRSQVFDPRRCRAGARGGTPRRRWRRDIRRRKCLTVTR